MENFEEELYSQRLLVFLEKEPQSNEYKQILLNEEQFKKLSNAIADLSEKVEGEDLKENMEVFDIRISEEDYFLPDLKEIN